MDIETLIAPVLRKICRYYIYKNSGYEVPQELLLSEIRADLNTISQRSTLNPVLLQQYQSIEKPLVFFIDYIIKEGNFSYSSSYRELARNFNELSGDDKFFDLLKEALGTGEDQEVIKSFYILMGLGFDGYYKRHRSEIIDVMHNTAGHFKKGADFNVVQITPDINLSMPESKDKGHIKWYKRPRSWLISSVLFLIISFFVNLASLSSNVGDFVYAVNRSVQSSSSFLNGANNTAENEPSEFDKAVKADLDNHVGAGNE